MKLKPKILKVSGLNSFLEEQTVEFDKLTEKGLFGIFGPTGSGKSSVLDAITLSLYGQTARKSTMYINTETEKLFLSFEFEAGHGEQRKKYKVERSLKRNNSGGINTTFVKLIVYDIDDNQEKIIEGRTSVENELESNIIGLNFNDFIRTVVLPQGKFSEFLTLTGAGRNEMLERILGLENYGEKLNRRTKQKRDIISQELNRIQGELSRYDGVSKEGIEELNKELTELTQNEKLLKAQIKELDDKHKEYNRVWNLQHELTKYLSIKEQLKENHEEFEHKKIKLSKGKNSLNVLPHIENRQKTLQDIEKNSEKLSQYSIEIDKLNSLIENNKTEYSIVLHKKEKVYPVLLERKSKVEQAIELLGQKKLLEKEIHELKTRHSSLENKIKNDTKEYEVLLNRDDKVNKEIEEKERLIASKSISSEYRKKLIDASDNEKRYFQLAKDKENNLIEKNKLLKSIDNNNKELKQISEQLKIVDDLLKELNNKKSLLESSKPENGDEVSEYQKKVFELSKIIERYKEISEKAETLKIKQKEIIIANEELNNRYNNLSIELKAKEEKLEDNKLKTKELEYKNLASILREQLVDSEPCPVCGSIHHPSPAVSMDSEEISVNQLLGKKLEEEKVFIQNNLVRLEEEIKNKSNEFDRIQQEFKEYMELLMPINITSLEEEKVALEEKIINLQEYRNKWDNEYKDLYDRLSKAAEERNLLDKKYTAYETNTKRDDEALKNLETKLSEIEKEISSISTKYEEQIKELGITSAVNRLKEVNKLDEEVEKLSEALKQLREENKKLKLEVTELEKTINKNNEDIKVIQQSMNDKGSRIDELGENIEKRVGKEEPIIVKNQIEKDISELLDKEKELREVLDVQNTGLNKLSEEKIGIEKAIEALKESLAALEKNLINALSHNNFSSIEEAINSRLENKDIEILENEIELYTNKVKDTDNNIARIDVELDGQSITEEEWMSIIDRKDKANNSHNDLIEEIGKKKNKIDEMTKNLKEVIKLKEEIEKLEKKLDIFTEILELTKGKKFVEYVSRSHLTYIAKVASERLKEITRERYELEYDSNNNFSIVDNYNGGARRECNSLSGGETFLTSLSLALALSSKIQLKGNTSLEFFFLDEGFGTLDNNLLDVVMTSLERLYSESLSVGIISHVEELRNRVPVKLIVTPAVAGVHGTKVKIEYS